MKKIDVDVWTEGLLVKMKILGQDDSLRGIDTIFRHDGITISSNSVPQIAGRGIVFVRGHEKSHDNETVGMSFDSNADAVDFCMKLRKVFHAFNNESVSTVPFGGVLNLNQKKTVKVGDTTYSDGQIGSTPIKSVMERIAEHRHRISDMQNKIVMYHKLKKDGAI